MAQPPRHAGINDGLASAPGGWLLSGPAGAAGRVSRRELFDRFRLRLIDPRFWMVQAMVGAVTLGHVVTELFTGFGGKHVDAIYFVPASLYFFPVLYASLNFGREGAIPTAVWSALLAVPNILIWHQGFERAGEAFQMTIMILLAIVVAWRVDKEVLARERAEKLERARGLSEVKYRALFDGAAEPILVLEKDGVIQEANAAAAAILGRTAADLKGSPTIEVMGRPAAQVLCAAVASHDNRSELHLNRPNGADIWLEPLCTTVPAAEGEVLAQVLLKDVTERHGFQQYAREITRAQEEERLRIAQELHDVSVQSAVLLCRRLDAIEDAAESEFSPPVFAALADARRAAEGIGDELRRFSRDLRPLILDDLGLLPAIKRLVAEVSERTSIRGRLLVMGSSRRLPSNIELLLFRIAQEALRNAEKHSEASRVTVRLKYAPEEVRLGITDDGKGFDVPSYTSLAVAGRLGLLGMRERARLAGGTCEIRSTPGGARGFVPGGSTRVEVCIPITPA